MMRYLIPTLFVFLVGCDDTPERDFFLFAKKTGAACVEVKDPQEIAGNYAVIPVTKCEPMPSPSPSDTRVER